MRLFDRKVSGSVKALIMLQWSFLAWVPFRASLQSFSKAQ
jgi:hypothetical protein